MKQGIITSGETKDRSLNFIISKEKAMENNYGVFFSQIEKCNPETYKGMQDFAKLLCQHYRVMGESSVDAMLSGLSIREIGKAVKARKACKELEMFAYAVHLGAKAATLDGLIELNGNSVVQGLTYIICAGTIIQQMLDPATIYSVSKYLVEPNDRSPEATQVRKIDEQSKLQVSNIYERIEYAKNITKQHPTPHFMPKPDTVIEVVRGEVGHLSKNVELSYRQALSL